MSFFNSGRSTAEPGQKYAQIPLGGQERFVKNINEVAQDCLGAVQVNCALVILGEYDERAAVNLLEVDVRHKPGGFIPRDLHCLGLRLRIDRLILGEVVQEWIVSARAHLPDELRDQGRAQAAA